MFCEVSLTLYPLFCGISFQLQGNFLIHPFLCCTGLWYIDGNLVVSIKGTRLIDTILVCYQWSQVNTICVEVTLTTLIVLYNHSNIHISTGTPVTELFPEKSELISFTYFDTIVTHKINDTLQYTHCITLDKVNVCLILGQSVNVIEDISVPYSTNGILHSTHRCGNKTTKLVFLTIDGVNITHKGIIHKIIAVGNIDQQPV